MPTFCKAFFWGVGFGVVFSFFGVVLTNDVLLDSFT